MGTDRMGAWRSLVRIGRWTATRRGINALGFALTLLSVLAISLGLVSALVAGAVYTDRGNVGRARTPDVVEGEGVTPALWWRPIGSGVGDRIVEVIALEPVAPDAPLPPGVAAWPEAGEAVLSPALHDVLQERGVPDRYGRVVGEIGRAGLASQTELFAYVRLLTGLDREKGGWPVSGFGVPPSGSFITTGELSYDRDVAEFWSLSAFLLVLPGIIGLVGAARVADSETRRRQVLLFRLGAGLWARTLAALPWIVASVLVSLFVSVGLATIASLTDVTIPFKGNVVDSAVVRGLLPWLVVLLVAFHFIAALALAMLRAGRLVDLHAGRLNPPQDRSAPVRTILLLVLLAGNWWIVSRTELEELKALSTLLAAMLVVILLAPALATLLRGVGFWRAPHSLARGRVGRFVGWRITTYRSRALARLMGTVSALVVVVGVFATVLALFTGPAMAARSFSDRVGTSLVLARPTWTEPHLLLEFAQEHSLGALAVTTEETYDQSGRLISSGATITGECPTLEALGLACDDVSIPEGSRQPRLDALISWYRPSGELRVQVGSPKAGQQVPTQNEAENIIMTEWLLASLDGADIDEVALARDAYQQGLEVEVEPMGAGALRGATDLLHKSYWMFVFGVPGVLTLLAAAALVWAAVVVEESIALTGNPLLAGEDEVFGQVATIRVGLPIAAAAAGGAAATLLLLAPHFQTGGAEPPTIYVAGVVLGGLIAAAAARTATKRLMKEASRRRWNDDTESGRVRFRVAGR